MEDSNRATTRAEAEKQQFTLPATYPGWQDFAYLIDGYQIAEEMGFDLMEWSGKRFEEHRATGHWNANVLELRLLLFGEARAAHFSWGEPFEAVYSLLQELSRLTGQPYQTDPALRAKYENQTAEDMGIVFEESPKPRKKRSKK